MNSSQNKITIDLSMRQLSNFGRVLNKLYYSDSTGFLKLAPNKYGYPHNGGEHSLRIWGSRDDCVAFIELLGETYPNVINECNAVMAAIECGNERISLAEELRKLHFLKIVKKLNILRGWDEPFPPEEYKWYLYKKFKHGVTIEATINWRNYTIKFARVENE